MADALELRNLLLEKLRAAGFDTGRQNQDYWYAVAKALAQIFTAGTLTHNNLSGRSDSDCHPMTAITGLVDALASKVNVNDIKAPHGFPLDDNDAQQTTISYNPTTRQVTVTALTGSTFDIWVKGVKYEIPSPHVSVAHNATEGKWFYYHDGNDFVWSQVYWSFDQIASVAVVYYSSIKGNGIGFDERHTALSNAAWHRWAHANLGTLMSSGGVLDSYVLDTDTDAAVTFGISQTVIDDEDLRTTIAALPDNGPYVIWRRQGVNGYWTYDTGQTFPFHYGTYARRNYDAGGGTGWTLEDIDGVGLGTYVNYYVCATAAIDSSLRFFLVPGQINHTTQEQAEDESWDTDVLKGDFPFLEVAPFAKVILKSRTTYTNSPKTRIVEVQYLRVSKPTGVGPNFALDGKVAAANGDGRDYLAQKVNAFSGLYQELQGAPPTQQVGIGIITGEDTDVLYGDVTWRPGATESLLGHFFFTSHGVAGLAKSSTLEDSWRATSTETDVIITDALGWTPLLYAEYTNIGLSYWPLGPWKLQLRLKKDVLAAEVSVRATVYRKTAAAATTQLFQTTFTVTDTDYDLYTYALTQAYSVGGKTDGLYILLEASTTSTDPVTVTTEYDDADLEARIETPLGVTLAGDITSPTNLYHCYAVQVTKGGSANYSFYGPDGWDEIAGGNYQLDVDSRMIVRFVATATVPASTSWQVRLLIDGTQHRNLINYSNSDASSSHLAELVGMWEVPYEDDDTHTYSIEMQAVGSTTVLMQAAASGSTENFILCREFYKVEELATLAAGADGGTVVITENNLSFSDNDIADVTTSQHGLCPKAPGDTSLFLRGDATWAAPAGGGGGTTWSRREFLLDRAYTLTGASTPLSMPLWDNYYGYTFSIGSPPAKGNAVNFTGATQAVSGPGTYQQYTTVTANGDARLSILPTWGVMTGSPVSNKFYMAAMLAYESTPTATAYFYLRLTDGTSQIGFGYLGSQSLVYWMFWVYDGTLSTVITTTSISPVPHWFEAYSSGDGTVGFDLDFSNEGSDTVPASWTTPIRIDMWSGNGSAGGAKTSTSHGWFFVADNGTL